MRPLIIPPALRPGDAIGVFAPSSYCDQAELEVGRAFLVECGYQVHLHPQTAARLHQSAGTPAEKAAAFHDLLRDPRIKAIMATSGGNRAGTMLPLVDFDLMRQNPKLYIGYSDSTAVLTALAARAGVGGIHGPTLKSMARCAPDDRERLVHLLAGHFDPWPESRMRCLRAGHARGPLVGGNISVFCALIGTPYMPDLSGAVLFFEDLAEELSRIDRFIHQLKLAGAFDKISGLIIGDVQTTDTGRRPFGFTLEDILLEHTAAQGLPIAVNAPFGHGADLAPLPVGRIASLNVSLTATTLELS